MKERPVGTPNIHGLRNHVKRYKTRQRPRLGLCHLIAHLPTLCYSVSQWCRNCLQNNVCKGSSGQAGAQFCGLSPTEDTKLDFTEITMS